MTNTTESPGIIAGQLARLNAELRAYLSGVASDLRADGLPAAPYAVLSFAKFLAWHAHTFDDAVLGAPFTIKELAAEIIAAALPLCGEKPQPKPDNAARIARLEAECDNLREVLANRKGEPL